MIRCFLLLLNGILIFNYASAAEPAKVEVVTKSATTATIESNVKKAAVNANSSVAHGNNTQDEIEDEGWHIENTTVVDTRRILFGKKVNKGNRPYMVYLQLTKDSAKAHKYRGWLCGGVIVHESYVLTSAACVEDADQFYIVSGTTKFVDSFDYKSDTCVCKHRRRVIWKCIPKNYKFDFADSIKWSSNDIAIVKVDKPFKIGFKEEGCEFAVCTVMYNNISKEMEKSGTKGYIAGWGTMGNFREGVYKRTSETQLPENARCLQEAKVCIMDNEQCAKKWAQRFRNIITQYMICTKDVAKRLSEICEKKYANCTDVEISRRQAELDAAEADNESWKIDVGRHLQDPEDYSARRSTPQGGFCENDHGGPLIVKNKNKDHVVVGVISACKIDPKSHSCHGPFLYTSIFYNRQFISCAIHKDIEQSCRRVFRTGITHEEYTVDWTGVREDSDDKKDDDSDDNDSDSRDEDGSVEVLRGSSGHSHAVLEKSVEKPKIEEKSETAKQDNESENKKVNSKEAVAEEKSKKHAGRKGKSKGHGHKKKKAAKEDAAKDEKNASYVSSSDENVNDPDSKE